MKIQSSSYSIFCRQKGIDTMNKLYIMTLLFYLDIIPWVLSCSGGSHEDRAENVNGSSICDGTNHFDQLQICCKTNGPCEWGQGHCNSDKECALGLLCGRNNCKKDFSNEHTRWSNNDNCCFGKLEKLRYVL